MQHRIIRPTALQQARNSLPTAGERVAMVLDSPLRQPGTTLHLGTIIRRAAG
jgi:hypothetical protein